MKNTKNAIALRSIAKDLKASAVKVRKSVANCPKASLSRPACGRHSELPTDTQWTKIKHGAFDAMKRERGNNRGLINACAEMVYNKKFGIC
jgi:hypothetical protein